MTDRRIPAAIAATALALALPTWAQAQDAGATPPPPAAADYGRDASIPFVDMGSIRDWRPDGNSALYVQDQRRNWYHAELMGPCTGLAFTDRIGFVTRGTNRLDRFATVIVDGERCAFQNFVTSAAPPPRARRNARPDQPAPAAAPAPTH